MMFGRATFNPVVFRRKLAAGCLTAAAACGGHAQTNSLPTSANTQGAAGSAVAAGSTAVSTFGGASTGGAAAFVGGAGQPALSAGANAGFDGGGATPTAPPGCPVVTRGAVCPAVELELDLARTTGDPSGVWAEPIQTPDYGSRPTGYYPPSENLDPASWDRSALPAGACVIRLHGLSPDCLRGGSIINHVCQVDQLENPTSAPGYYESNRCEQLVGPGCPTADPWNASGFWWYLSPDDSTIDLVMCAPECAASLRLYSTICLRLPGPRP